jgi:hypothetical protein
MTSSDLMELSYDNMENIVKEVAGDGKTEAIGGNVANGVLFRMMYHRRGIGVSPSGIEVSIHDVDWKKSFRRVRSVNGQISISCLKTAYGELREINDSEIQPKFMERKRRDDKVHGLNNKFASSLKNVSVTVYHDSSLRRGFYVTVEGGEDLIEDCLSFLEQRCGRKDNLVEEQMQ